MNGKLLVSLGLCAGLGLLAFFWQSAPRESVTSRSGPAQVRSPITATTGDNTSANTQGDRNIAPASDSAFIQDLRTRFGPHIHRPHAQIRSLEQLISFLQQHYPEDWQSRIREFLQRLFPDLADELYARFNQLMQYNAWLRQNRDRLRSLPAEQRRAELWQARTQAFGPDAQQIWQAELRSRRLATALGELDSQQPATAQLDQWVASMHEIYGDKTARLLDQHRTELLGRFIEREPIQQQLASQDANTRRHTLRALRERLGMDSAALQRWEALDTQRDQLWAQGQAYMAERRQLLEQSSNADMQWQLEKLRERHFSPQLAELLAQEEASGFLRFAGERRYGRE